MRHRFGWHLPAILFGSLLASIVVGALAYLYGTKEVPARGGTYVEAITGTPTSLNPLLASFNDADRDITSLLFSGLTRLDKDGTVLPDLAESWQAGEDGKSFTFQLRPGLKWHDDVPFTAEDAVFTFNLAKEKDLGGNPELAALLRTVDVQADGDASVRFTLDKPLAPFLAYTTLGMLPRHLLGNLRPKDVPAAAFNIGPVGTGPFRLERATLAQVSLEANPDDYLQQPWLERVQFKFFPDDQAVVAAVATRQVDGALLRPSVGPDALDQVKANHDLRTITAPRASFSLLFLNTQGALFKEKGVRQAIAYGIDHERLVEEAVGGQGIPTDSPFVPNSWAYAPGRHYAYDPAHARQLLDEQGWQLNKAGMREKDGQPFRFSLLTNDDPQRMTVAAELSTQLGKLGIQAEVGPSSVSALVQSFLLPRKFEAILYGIDPGPDPDPYPLWHSSQASGDGLNLAEFADPEVDRLLEQARATPDMEARRVLYQQFQAAFSDEVPSIPLYYPVYTYVITRSVQGVSLGVLYDTSSRFENVREWYKVTQRVFKT